MSNMNLLRVFSLVGALAAAAPLTDTSASFAAVTVDSTISKCLVAPNCETYEDPTFGTRIRFIPGMEPKPDNGTEPRIESRQGQMLHFSPGMVGMPKTYITVGRQTVDYGIVGSSGVYGAIHKVYDICHQNGCDTSPFVIPTRSASDMAAYETKVTLRAQGVYKGRPERDAFVEALVAVANESEQCWDQNWMNGGGYGQSVQSGSLRICKNTNFIQVSKYEAESKGGALLGFMNVQIEQEPRDYDACNMILGLIGGGVSGFDPTGYFGSLSSIVCQ
jgi:hypothetical protein